MSTLDEQISGRQILLLKLDVQGHELRVLESGIKVLQRTRFVLTEMSNHRIYSGGCQYYEVDEFLRMNDFQLVNISAAYSNTGLGEFDSLYRNNRF
jgi:hypothetical protein